MIHLLYLFMDVYPWHDVFIYLLLIFVTFFVSNWACVELFRVMVHWLIVNQNEQKSSYRGLSRAVNHPYYLVPVEGCEKGLWNRLQWLILAIMSTLFWME